ncbi:response regulator [Anabaena cylindrica FACHB-243]|uniref:Circadian input-output histidine kinase CikA n=1 Tax=Anabaena cylindrica (strain ATCC 27899 / PCC 7122) TaxID=272123 RepID=K9ZG19_ANACC|nr:MULTISPECIES: ATP-binding protein [Anabaena]AFZ58168.1 PAS/PAC sensor hybrid histidine kinase [Anabaena cylindrica PCC 7122]MBD2419056.1 response regulator [Anabaena cylindrica FACHB-243]MBY5281204.1 response regulator [Anabaena sp. CCAP 1446/1C]MBY5310273.1 response regulator [Anabaena sp. CCAP 1446/1C]MCM2409525.1 ATP-binding protein [Anabaena sp. CCAP 1446/1C]
MPELWNIFFNSDQFIPHGHCYLWKTDLVSLHLVSDGLIALAYYSIPITLFYFVNKRKDLPFSWIFLLFSAFIIACGTTHLLAIWTLWYPIYWLSGLIKAVTALVSVITAVELVPLIPQAIALPSPMQLQQINQELQTEISDRLRIDKELRKYQNHLEDLVTLRTQEITNTNEQLKQEIAERQRILEVLRQSEERYRYLVEAIPQLVWTSNAKGECDYFNQNWSEYTGLTFEESLDDGWLAALHPDDMESSYTVWLNAIESGTKYENEYRFKRADGCYRWQLARGLPLKDEQGCIVKWFGTCTDIHENKEIQQERAHLLELEQAARTQAETANRIKDEFLAVLSHELRTPLNSILGWSQLLQTHKLDDIKISQALATIERNAKLQVQLIEDLLDVSRILQGKLVLNTAEVNLESTILSTIETIRLAANTKSIQIKTVLPENLGKVLGDPTRLQQVIWNLLSNAVKFTPRGGMVEVQLGQVDDYAQITVSDTGKGISDEFLPYVFDYFRQADSSSTRKFGGLGLGLAIVRNIVEMHGGIVSAESPGIGQGARFTVRLPLIKDDSSRVMDEECNSSIITLNYLSLNGVKVLVVDDDVDSLDFVAFVLEEDGAEVMAVSSGLQAIEVLSQSQVDVLISDISMPEIDGYMLIREVRSWRSKQGEKTPIASELVPKAIALTAYAGEYDQRQALAAGFQLHLSKPIIREDLVRAIAQVMNLSPS